MPSFRSSAEWLRKEAAVVWAVVWDTGNAYLDHGGAMLAAALAFYVMLAAAPFGVFLVAFAGSFYGEERAREQLVGKLTEAVGPGVSGDVAGVLDRAGHAPSTVVATVIGFVLFAMATSRVFTTVSDGLNHVWGVRPIVPASVRGAGLRVLERRMAALAMVLFTGLVFLGFLVLRTALDVLAEHTWKVPFLLRLFELLFGWLAITAVTAAVYRVLPDARIAYRDAIIGAGVTGALAVLGAFVAGQYVAKLAVTSPYGAAGSLVAFLLWVYYCAQVFFFGAEFTAAWSRHRGLGVHPLPHARRITVEEHVEPPSASDLETPS